MEYVEAILLGIVQGIAEFLPISSSGHLVIAGDLIHRATGREMNLENQLQLNVAVHLGTLFSILVVYRNDLLRVLRDVRLCLLIVLATIPVAVVGLLFHDVIEQQLQSPLSAGIMLFLTAALLLCANASPGGNVELNRISVTQAGLIGLFQAFAIVPGISRSGSTISGGLILDLKPDDAARFSFLIAVPAIGGAVVLTAAKMAKGEGSAQPLSVLAVGAAVAFVVGWASLSWLIGIVRRGQLRWFAWYCVAVGTATVLWQLAERAN